jgi:LysR family hydrogen peroxide-inducible transcriptional activator
MMKLPSNRQLQYFTALAHNGHFGRAAEACFVSQSAFSNAIKELETLLDVQLVDRTNRSVTITATGQQVATQARLCLQDVSSLVEIAAGARQPLTGELRLGVIPTIAPFMLPRILPKLRRQYPELQLYLIEDQTQRIYDRLMAGELDVLLLALPWDMRGVDVSPLFKDPFCLAYRDGTDRVEPTNYRFNQLNKDSVLLLEDGHCLRDHALAACKIRNSQALRRFGASSLLTLVEMVDADLGITFLPEMARGTSVLKNTRVKLHPLDEKSFRTIGLCWRKGSGRVDEFRLLGDFLQQNR